MPEKKNAAIKNALDKARNQATRYAAGDALKNVPNVKRVAVIYKGLEIAACDVF